MTQQQDECIAYFSTLCQDLFNPEGPSKRDEIQKILEASFPTFSSSDSTTKLTNVPSFGIVTPTDTANALRIMLENSPNPYVQTFSLSRLKQLVMAQFTIFDKDTKIQLRTFLLQYAYIHPDLQPFVITQLASVLALLTRFGWLDIEEYQNVYKDMTQFLQASHDHRIVGLQILSIIVQDINSTSMPKYAAKFRKAAVGLRDSQLFDIFTNAYQLLEGLLTQSIPFDKVDQENSTKDATLDLLLRCLSFDFAGNSLDEAGEDTGMIQIPVSWRPIFEREDFIPSFFKAYAEFPSSCASKAIECLVHIAATRKALFSSEDQRNKFIDALMHGIRDIIVTSTKLDDSDCYNGFCRLLHRFRMMAPLNEMADRPNYVEWIDIVADFTLRAFQANYFMPTSTFCFHLLSFWSRIVQSMAYYQQLSETVAQKLQQHMLTLTSTFISNFLNTVPTRIEEMWDDPLEDEDTLVESLFMLGLIARCKYEKSCAALIEIFDPIAAHYEELINQASIGSISEENLKEALEIFSDKFTWLVYIMGVYVGNRPPYLSSDSCDEADGQLTTKVLQLMEVNQNLSQNNSAFRSKKLDSAFVFFFSQFRRAYVGESNPKSAYKKLNEIFGVESETDMLNVIMRKIGYSALRNLRKIETTSLIMQNHMSSEFTFFNYDKHKHNRMLYYQILCKILFAEDNCENEFYEFMKPFEAKLESLFRDLRGFIQPIQSRRNYSLFLNWFYPDYMPVLMKGIQAWSPHPSTNVLLKFFCEFIHNKSQRLNLEVSSATGVLIFKDASQILSTYGQQIISTQITDESQKYPLKYKGITTCFNILSKCLGGKYINFGVFWLYQDKAITEAFMMMLRMMLNIPLDDLMNFPKLTTAFFIMLDEYSSEQMMIDSNLPPEAFLYILEACEQGIESTDSMIRSHACATINNIYLCIHLCYLNVM
ncbi:armadillo-type protein [Cokeromyces recurvatus]|uniref:armadillo-type protein n=1 Tax=Cokeromyces recurvatus TaxID=90255 RepID=UPI00222010AC|nr:armadillo-type protein [Cokeromyces recurvatus]KAI7904443.1 armadillo-type protein [Cokeromyces recurvatus]